MSDPTPAALNHPGLPIKCPFCQSDSLQQYGSLTYFTETCANARCGYSRYVETDLYGDEEPWLERWC